GHPGALADVAANLLGSLASGILRLENDDRVSFIAALESDPVAGDKAGRLLDGRNDLLPQVLRSFGPLLDAHPRDDCMHWRDPPYAQMEDGCYWSQREPRPPCRTWRSRSGQGASHAISAPSCGSRATSLSSPIRPGIR